MALIRRVGTNQDDTLYGRNSGSNYSEWFLGRDGDDEIYAGLGDDRVDGEKGHDRLFGDEGVDTMYGGAGNDVLDGGPDNNFLSGGPGNDTLYGGYEGADDLLGGDGNDVLSGGFGHERLWGGDGDDKLHAGHGDLDGGTGSDVLYSWLIGPDIRGHDSWSNPTGTFAWVNQRGGIGADQFHVEGFADGTASWADIHDFRSGEGDKVSLTQSFGPNTGQYLDAGATFAALDTHGSDGREGGDGRLDAADAAVSHDGRALWVDVADGDHVLFWGVQSLAATDFIV
jgi:Ca2+-binding RTX toxin-like protein